MYTAPFPHVGPVILTCLFQTYCPLLYSSALWSLSYPALYHIEVAFNKILRRIWHLPFQSHTGIVHCVANLESLNNLVYQRSTSLLSATLKCPSILVRAIFRHSSCSYCFFLVYNSLFGLCHQVSLSVPCVCYSYSLLELTLD